MIRRLANLIHRNCRHQIEGLADAADRQTQRAENLAGELDETVEQLTAARSRIAQGLDHILVTAHQQGRLARTYALLEGAGLGHGDGLAAWLLQIRMDTWTGLPDWGCQNTNCPRVSRGLVWHPTTPENAHLACECGRIWPAGPGAVDRGEREARGHHITETQTQAPFQRRWSQIPVSMLEAMDRALPTPAQLRDHETAPA